MTNPRKLEILWQLYFIAVGLDTLMTMEEILERGDNIWGLCELMNHLGIYEDLVEIIELEPDTNCYRLYGWWWSTGDWHIRSKALLKAIKKVSKEIKQ